MNRYRLAVVVEDDDFKEPAGPVGSDVEITVALAEHAYGVPDRVLESSSATPCLRALPAIST